MPKISMTFNLPVDEEEFKLAKNGSDLAYAMDEFDNWLRSKIKYQDLSEQDSALYQEVRKVFWECRNRE